MNGIDVTQNVSNQLSLSLSPQTATLLAVPLSHLLTPGSLYTVMLQYVESDAAESVAGGRIAKAHFPIESWPKSSECPFPTINDSNFQVCSDAQSRCHMNSLFIKVYIYVILCKT